MLGLGRIVIAAEAGFAYDMMLERGNAASEALIVGGVNGFIGQTQTIERILATLGLNHIALEGSDSLDNPSTVFECALGGRCVARPCIPA